FVQELVFEPLVVDDLPHGGQGLFDIGARPRRQVVALQQPLEGAVDPQHLVVDHASTSRRAFSSKVGNAPGSMTWTLKRRPSWAYASSSAMRRASGSRSSSRTSGSGSSWPVISAALATLTKRDRLVRGGIDDLLDEVVLGDVDAAAAGGALEPGNTGGLGHAREVARAGTPLLLDEPLGGLDGCAGLTGVDEHLDAR